MGKEYIGKRRELPIYEDSLDIDLDNLWVFPGPNTDKVLGPNQIMIMPTEIKPIKIVAPNDYEFNINLDNPYEIEASRKLTIEEIIDLFLDKLDYN